MTRPDIPESKVRELQALYREAATDEPGPWLDRSILDAARAELRTTGNISHRRNARSNSQINTHSIAVHGIQTNIPSAAAANQTTPAKSLRMAF